MGKCCVSGNNTGAYILTGNTVPSVGEESLNTTSIVQLIPLIFAIRMNLMRDVVKTSASCVL